MFKGTIRVILINPPCNEEVNAWFTTVHLKYLAVIETGPLPGYFQATKYFFLNNAWFVSTVVYGCFNYIENTEGSIG